MDDIYNLSKSELTNLLDHNKFPSYRADQIWRYLYKNYVINFEEMGNIVYEDILSICNNLPPQLCKKAFKETVGLLRSKPVDHN